MFRTIAHGVCDSTSERAFAALTAGSARHGDVHTATGQTAGRGRRGARWESASGAGLYLSAILLPAAPGPPPAGLTMAAGLAVRAAARALGASTAAVKWPNDVLVGRAKLAGILVESRGLDPAAPHYVVGIGLNVAQREFSPELERERPVTSLARLGLAAGVDDAARAVLAALATRLEQLERSAETLAADYRRALCGDATAPRVRVVVGAREYEGRWLALSLRDGLTLERDGQRETLALAHVRALAVLAG